MPRPRDDSDPLKNRRRQLAEQERLLARKRQELRAQISSTGPAAAKAEQPPVWRLEDEMDARPVDPTPSRKRHLARQRQRDMMLFFAFIGLLLIVLVVLMLVAYIHLPAPTTGSVVPVTSRQA